MLNKKLLVGLLTALCLGFISQNLFAQSNNLAKVYFVEVKSGQGAEFVAAEKEHAEWRKKAGDPWTWYVYQIVNGKNLGDYIIRSGGHTWADFDSYEDFLARGAVEFNKTVGPHMKSISSIITAGDTVNVNWPANPADVNLISIITYHLKPGQGPIFAQAVNKYHTAIQENKRDAHYSFDWTVNGEKGPTVRLALPYKNWADMKGPEESLRDFMKRVLGEENAQKIYMELSDTYTSTESMILRVRSDLSVIHEK